MPKASAFWDTLTAGSSVSCINSFVPSDDYYVSFFVNSVLQPVLPPAAALREISHFSTSNQHVFRREPAVIRSATNIFSEKAGQFAQPPTCPRHRHFIETTLPSRQHVLNQPTNDRYPSLGQPPSYFSGNSDYCLASHHHVIAVIPFGNHAPSVGQPPTCFRLRFQFNRRTTVSFQLK